MPYWLSRCIFQTEFSALFTLMTLAFSLRTYGRWHFPRTGPALIVANHQSFLDPILIGLSLPRRASYLARRTLWGPQPFTWIIEHLGGVPIDHEGVGKEGIKTILSHLEKGKAVVVFPEGTRTSNGGLQPLRSGIHLLIRRTQAPIVPLGIAGAFEAWPRRQPMPTLAPLILPAARGSLAVVVGRPLAARRFAELPREESLAELRQEIGKVHEQAEHLRRKPR